MFSSSQSVEEPVSASAEEESGNSQDTEVMDSQELLEVEERLRIEKPIEVAKELPNELAKPIPSSLPTPLPTLRRESSGTFGYSMNPDSFPSAFKSFSSTPGYLANRWNATNSSFSTPASSQAKSFTTPAM
jgi:hypothetical protein